MSLLHCNGPRHFSRPTSARTFPETYYNERHAPIDYPRVDPYAYPMGGPVSGPRGRSHIDREEFQVEPPGLRRRIAVACARCRKRKIRCSGDKGDGLGCQNCRQAGVDASQCQFHRVGSDSVHKVLDNYSMAQSLASMASTQEPMPLYPAGGNGHYHRTMHSQQYPQLDIKSRYPQLIDTKPVYTSDWTIPYGDDTSPVESYSFDQSSVYLPAPTTPADSNLDRPSYRWAHSPARPAQPATSYYSDYGHTYIANGLPYLQTDIRPSTATEPISPLNMSSLQLSLPERPRLRQLQPTEVPLTPRRQLPAPQSNPGLGLHHALDQQQDQRLRSTQTIATPSFSNTTPSYNNASSFTKPLLPWTAANENLLNAVNETTTAAVTSGTTAMLPANTTDTSSNFFPTRTTTDDAAGSIETAPSTKLNFSTSPLLDPSTITAPNLPTYSNFRESRNLSMSSATQLQRNNSSSSLYTYDNVSRRPSFPNDNPSSNLVSGHRYTPLSQSGNTLAMQNIAQEPSGSRTPPLHRASMSNLTSSF